MIVNSKTKIIEMLKKNKYRNHCKKRENASNNLLNVNV